MGKAPALAPCLFCGEMPCVCAKRTRAAAKSAPVREAFTPTAPTAPTASRRRFDATDAMREASTVSPVGVRIPAPVARPVRPVDGRSPVPLPGSADTLPAILEARQTQAQQDSDAMDNAVRLVRVALGGRVIDE